MKKGKKLIGPFLSRYIIHKKREEEEKEKKRFFNVLLKSISY